MAELLTLSEDIMATSQTPQHSSKSKPQLLELPDTAMTVLIWQSPAAAHMHKQSFQPSALTVRAARIVRRSIEQQGTAA